MGQFPDIFEASEKGPCEAADARKGSLKRKRVPGSIENAGGPSLGSRSSCPRELWPGGLHELKISPF
jgi:hypothetical protein